MPKSYILICNNQEKNKTWGKRGINILHASLVDIFEKDTSPHLSCSQSFYSLTKETTQKEHSTKHMQKLALLEMLSCKLQTVKRTYFKDF